MARGEDGDGAFNPAKHPLKKTPVLRDTATVEVRSLIKSYTPCWCRPCKRCQVAACQAVPLQAAAISCWAPCLLSHCGHCGAHKAANTRTPCVPPHCRPTRTSSCALWPTTLAPGSSIVRLGALAGGLTTARASCTWACSAAGNSQASGSDLRTSLTLLLPAPAH